MINITFLGTSSMVPTIDRNHTSILLSYNSQNMLIDCGEGTQRQLKVAKFSATKINKILITHWHGDHVLGLPGLIQTLASNDYDKTLEIYGPVGTKKKINYMFKAFEFDQNKIQIKVYDIKKEKFFENNDFFLQATPLEHMVPCLGYSFNEKDKRKIQLNKAKKLGLNEGPLLGKLQDGKSIKLNKKTIKPNDVSYIINGKKISFVFDTILCKNAYKLSKNADLLICESTYTSDLQEKSEKYFHMTAKNAAKIANESNVKKLVLTHLSARYKDTTGITKDAKDIFDNVECAYDFFKIKV
jgi:ribonuclease Z